MAKGPANSSATRIPPGQTDISEYRKQTERNIDYLLYKQAVPAACVMRFGRNSLQTESYS